MFHIVLVEPEIPQNTGNIVRTCAATGSVLHLVRPLGFEVSDKYLKRAGLDYWHLADIRYYDSFAELADKVPEGRFWFFSTKAKRVHSDVAYRAGDFLVFGKETKGLPEELLRAHYDAGVRIPMIDESRSLRSARADTKGFGQWGRSPPAERREIRQNPVKYRRIPRNSAVIFLYNGEKEGRNMARKIVVTSGKGGVGKTTLTANLGIALARTGARVVLADIDFGLNNLDVVMGVENKVVYDISDVLDGRCRVRQALVQDVSRKNLYVLPSNSLKASSNVTGQNVKLIMEKLNASFDFILLDCPAGIDVGFHRAVSVADEAIVVTTPALSSLRDADKVVSILASYRLEKVGLVVNRARGDLELSGESLSARDVEAILKTPLIGVLPEEDAVFLSTGYGIPVKSASGQAYKLLAQNVMKGTKKLYDVTRKYSGFFGSIRRSLKRSV